MSEDITKELPMSDSEKLTQLLAISRNVIAGLNQLDARVTTVENDLAALKAGTNPFWQVMHDQQQQTLTLLQEHSTLLQEHSTLLQEHSERMDRMEAHLQQQDEKLAGLDEKMTTGFRKLGEKFDQLVLDYYELRTDIRDLNRRVTRLEPVN